MGKVVLYIAMSLDGFIADRAGGVDWLAGQDMGGGDSEKYDSYGEFIQGVDTVLMGWRTYRQVREELAPGDWPYQGLRCYVFTHHEAAEEENICFVQGELAELVRRLQGEPGGDIWLCGGADIARQAMAADLVDRWHIAVIPVILGGGVRLFGEMSERELRLLRTVEYNGIVELVYERR